ncbi:MAG: Lacal_2735 family protein [Flavobacteriales bacterium]
MNRIDLIKKHQTKLSKQYKELVEEAYNLRQIDSVFVITIPRWASPTSSKAS